MLLPLAALVPATTGDCDFALIYFCHCSLRYYDVEGVTVFAAMVLLYASCRVTATTLAPARGSINAPLLSMVAHQSSARCLNVSPVFVASSRYSPIVIFLACCAHSFDKTISNRPTISRHPFVPVTVVRL